LDGLDTNGQLWSLKAFRGQAVLLNFWASWCEPCRTEMPSLQSLAQFYGTDKLKVLTINFKEPRATVQRYMQRADLTLPVILDPDGRIAKAWGVKVFPSTVLIGADGQVKGVMRGEVDWTSPEVVRGVESLLATPPK
jgi:thiol-disulfide isomerase/thioredoxin